MTVNDEGDSEGDDDCYHHPPGLEIIMRTVPDNQDTAKSAKFLTFLRDILPVVRLQQEVLVVKHVVALVVDNDKIRCAEEGEEYGLEGGDHHLVDGAGDEHQQHAVGEVLREVSDWLVVSTGQAPIILLSVHNPHFFHHLRGCPVAVVPATMSW